MAKTLGRAAGLALAAALAAAGARAAQPVATGPALREVLGALPPAWRNEVGVFARSSGYTATQLDAALAQLPNAPLPASAVTPYGAEGLERFVIAAAHPQGEEEAERVAGKLVQLQHVLSGRAEPATHATLVEVSRNVVQQKLPPARQEALRERMTRMAEALGRSFDATAFQVPPDAPGRAAGPRFFARAIHPSAEAPTAPPAALAPFAATMDDLAGIARGARAELKARYAAPRLESVTARISGGRVRSWTLGFKARPRGVRHLFELAAVEVRVDDGVAVSEKTDASSRESERYEIDPLSIETALAQVAQIWPDLEAERVVLNRNYAGSLLDVSGRSRFDPGLRITMRVKESGELSDDYQAVKIEPAVDETPENGRVWATVTVDNWRGPSPEGGARPDIPALLSRRYDAEWVSPPFEDYAHRVRHRVALPAAQYKRLERELKDFNLGVSLDYVEPE